VRGAVQAKFGCDVILLEAGRHAAVHADEAAAGRAEGRELFVRKHARVVEALLHPALAGVEADRMPCGVAVVAAAGMERARVEEHRVASARMHAHGLGEETCRFRRLQRPVRAGQVGRRTVVVGKVVERDQHADVGDAVHAACLRIDMDALREIAAARRQARRRIGVHRARRRQQLRQAGMQRRIVQERQEHGVAQHEVVDHPVVPVPGIVRPRCDVRIDRALQRDPHRGHGGHIDHVRDHGKAVATDAFQERRIDGYRVGNRWRGCGHAGLTGSAARAGT
jgi:hypothetical protein